MGRKKAKKIDVSKRQASASIFHPEGVLKILTARYDMWPGFNNAPAQPALVMTAVDVKTKEEYNAKGGQDNTLNYTAGKSSIGNIKPSRDGKNLESLNDAWEGIPENSKLDLFFTALIQAGIDPEALTDDVSTLEGMHIRFKVEQQEGVIEGEKKTWKISIPVEIVKSKAKSSDEDEDDEDEEEEEDDDREESSDSSDDDDDDEDDDDEEDEPKPRGRRKSKAEKKVKGKRGRPKKAAKDDDEDDDDDEPAHSKSEIEDAAVSAIKELVDEKWDKKEDGIPIAKIGELTVKRLKKNKQPQTMMDAVESLIDFTEESGEKFLKNKNGKKPWAFEEGKLWAVGD